MFSILESVWGNTVSHSISVLSEYLAWMTFRLYKVKINGERSGQRKSFISRILRTWRLQLPTGSTIQICWQFDVLYCDKINQNYIVSILGYYLPSLVYTPCLRHTMVIQQGWSKNACISASSVSCKALGHNCLMLAIVNLMLVAWCEQGVNRCYTCICILSFGLRIFHVTITTLSDIMNIHKAFFPYYLYSK